MSFLNAVINAVQDEFVKEQLQDRIDIVGHKIKFMDKVPVAVLNSKNEVNQQLNELVVLAGGEIQQNPAQAKVLIYLEPESSMLNLMGEVPALLDKEWPAVEFNRIYLMEPLRSNYTDAEGLVEVLEDIAEMLNPGYFIFGNEGKTWTSFGV
jgi:hypothetical protein